MMSMFFVGCDKATTSDSVSSFETKTATDVNGYSYEYVTNDPLKARIYTLENGLKVYLSQYNASPRIQTYIAVKAGGKYDPVDATGLAHYLEHMMFKGTSKFGTQDWEKEKVFLDSIEQMFETYRTIKDPAKRKEYYSKIDKVSNEASNYAIANEYDKLVSNFGAKGTNAYTTEDRTVYVNDIPSNELNKWLELESERFSMIVNRLFHTELEAVYEEKNRSLDNDYWKVYEGLAKKMFPDHKYGTQTVIGTIDHLKNPSITKIRAYFDKYYIPNNVAICLSGDLDYESTIQQIDTYFGKWEKKELTPYKIQPSAPLASNQEIEVFGPNAEFVTLGYKFPGNMSEERVTAKLCDMILSNATAGLIDLNLKQSQKVIDPSCYIWDSNDHSVHVFSGTPREGQSLEEVKDLLVEQIEKVKKGEFEDWLIDAIVNDFKISKLRELENNGSRAHLFVDAFTNDLAWSDYIDDINQMKSLSKQDVIDFANKYYTNHVVAYKRTGEDPNKQKVEKPEITQVQLNRDKESAYLKTLINKPAEQLKPVFLNYKEDVAVSNVREEIPVWSKKNDENDLFKLYYQIDRGSNNNPTLKIAVEYLEYLGIPGMSSADLKKEFYKLGCNFNVYAGDDKVYISLNGLDENMEAAVSLFEKLINEAVGDEEALRQMVSGIIKKREDTQKDKRSILFTGLNSYAKYGSHSPLTNVLSNEQLKSLKAEELTDILHKLTSMEHKVLYYGPRQQNELVGVLKDLHKVPTDVASLPERKVFPTLDMASPRVFWVDYDMVQAEVIFLAKAEGYDPKREAAAALFNEYFGGSMSSIVFTEMRESKALAYSVWSQYAVASEKINNDYMFAYIGTQADKLESAMEGMTSLLENPPKEEKAFEMAKTSLLKKLESERVMRDAVLFNYENALKKGLEKDIRKDIYEAASNMTMDDVMAFHKEFIQGKKYNIAVVGSKDKLKMDVLAKYGEVKQLNVEDLFGFEKGVEVIPSK